MSQGGARLLQVVFELTNIDLLFVLTWHARHTLPVGGVTGQRRINTNVHRQPLGNVSHWPAAVSHTVSYYNKNIALLPFFTFSSLFWSCIYSGTNVVVTKNELLFPGIVFCCSLVHNEATISYFTSALVIKLTGRHNNPQFLLPHHLRFHILTNCSIPPWLCAPPPQERGELRSEAQMLLASL